MLYFCYCEQYYKNINVLLFVMCDVFSLFNHTLPVFFFCLCLSFCVSLPMYLVIKVSFCAGFWSQTQFARG